MSKILVLAILLEEILVALTVVLVLVLIPLFPMAPIVAVLGLHQWYKDGGYIKWWWSAARDFYIPKR